MSWFYSYTLSIVDFTLRAKYFNRCACPVSRTPMVWCSVSRDELLYGHNSWSYDICSGGSKCVARCLGVVVAWSTVESARSWTWDSLELSSRLYSCSTKDSMVWIIPLVTSSKPAQYRLPDCLCWWQPKKFVHSIHSCCRFLSNRW